MGMALAKIDSGSLLFSFSSFFSSLDFLIKALVLSSMAQTARKIVGAIVGRALYDGRLNVAEALRLAAGAPRAER